MTVRTTLALALLAAAALAAGCSLDWDGPRPAADARVDVPTVDGPAVDAWTAQDRALPDTRRHDFYQQDLPWPDASTEAAAPPDSAPADASTDWLQTDAPPCGYRYSGQAAADASAAEVNALTAQGWQPKHFVHAADDHAAWLKDNTGHYEVARATSGKTLEALVSARLGAGQGHTVEELLANKDYAVWMESSGAYLYVGATTSSAVITALQKQVKLGWTVRSYTNQPGPSYAAWLRQGDSFKLLENNYNYLLKNDVVKQSAAGWVPQGFLATDGYAGWAYHPTKKTYDFAAFTQASGLLNWLQQNKVNGWDASMIHGLHLHSVWLTNGHYILYADDGWDLAGQLYQHLQVVPAAQVERFFAKQGYVVWLYKSCP